MAVIGWVNGGGEHPLKFPEGDRKEGGLSSLCSVLKESAQGQSVWCLFNADLRSRGVLSESKLPWAWVSTPAVHRPFLCAPKVDLRSLFKMALERCWWEKNNKS